jgi:hypothetical protein
MRAQGAVFLVLYYAVGVLFYSHRYDWGILDSGTSIAAMRCIAVLALHTGALEFSASLEDA